MLLLFVLFIILSKGYFADINKKIPVSVKEQPVPEYLTTSFGILGQLDKNF